MTLRNRLKRFNRKTLGYSKSADMHDNVIETFIKKLLPLSKHQYIEYMTISDTGVIHCEIKNLLFDSRLTGTISIVNLKGFFGKISIDIFGDANNLYHAF